MKRLLFLKYALIATVTALLLTSGVAAQESCESANALLNAALYEKAQANYTDLLMKYPNLTCAQDGVLKAQNSWAINLYEIGQAYENASQFQEARVQYLEALKKYPSYIRAQEALEKVSDDKFAAVQTLADLGYYTEAAVRLKKVVEENPGINVPKDLEYLPGRSLFIWGDIRNWIEIWGQTVVELVIFLLSFFLVAYVLIYKIRPRIMGSRRPSLDIVDFDKGTTGFEIDKGLWALVEESYIMLGHEGRNRVNLVTGPSPDKLEIPAPPNAQVAPYFKFVSELIDWLFPPNVITLSGYTLKSGSLVSGITFALAENQTKNILDSCTIWQNKLNLETTPKKEGEPTDPTSYYCLAEPVAVWVFFQLGNISKKTKNEKFTIMGTDDWQSYAYFKAGVRWHIEGRLDKAHQLYVESLGRDMKNWGALFNLGRLEMEEGQYQHAYGRLKQVREFSNSNNIDKKSMFIKDTMWYLATYNLALTLRYMSEQHKNNLSDGKKATKALIETIEKIRIDIMKNDETLLKCDISRAEKKAKTLLETIHEIIAELQTAEHITEEYILHCLEGKPTNQVDSIKKAIEEWSMAEQKVRTIQKDIIKWPMEKQEKRLEGIITDLKNMESPENKPAPFEFIKFMAEQEAKDLMVKVWKAKEATKENVDKKLKEFLESFYATACIMSANTLLYVDKIDEAVKIIKMVEPFEKLNFRSRYNLACYYSIYGEKDKRYYRNALNNLEYALERRGTIVQWAQKDPSLKGVREDENIREDFDRLIQKYSQPPTQASSEKLPLAGLTIIQEKYATQLKEQGTVSPCDLILNAGTPSARKALAKKLGISTALLLRWALLADLMRIVEDTKQINLLEAADYGSIEALQKVSDPCGLADLLNQVNKAQSFVDQSPSCETVQQWLQESKKTKLMVIDNHSVIK